MPPTNLQSDNEILSHEMLMQLPLVVMKNILFICSVVIAKAFYSSKTVVSN